MPVIGYLTGASMTGEAGFKQGLRETGLIEGRDFQIEHRSTAGQMDRLPAIVAEVVARRVSVILAVSDSFALAAKAVTTAIPIVYIGGNDPVDWPGFKPQQSRWQCHWCHGAQRGDCGQAPTVAQRGVSYCRSIAAILDPATPNLEIDTESLLAAAKALGVQVHILRAGTAAEISAAIETIGQRQLGPVVVGPSPFFNTQGKQLAAQMLRHSLAAIFQLASLRRRAGW